ncbi:MAG: hypothetical protein ABSH50_04010 [Bryobacteraceae bacterium]|jgi:hypothetical protein
MKKFAFAATLLVAAYGQQNASAQLAANQTFGYGNNEVVTFTYGQSFMCVDEPGWDLNYNGIKAESDPSEFQTPICQVGIQPAIGPEGPVSQAPTEPIYVLIPMFSVDNDQNPNDAISCTGVVAGTNCGPALGSTLISLFGSLPEGFKAKPLVYTQCPDPASVPGTCTMHASRVDLGLALEQLGLLPPPPANYFAPTPNHSHVVINSDVNTHAIWWEVIPVLVTNAADWPNQAGTTGITSKTKLTAAVQAGTAIEVPSNFFLFFASGGAADMPNMHTMANMH